MFQRAMSLLLITALLACPLRCGLVMCAADEEASADGASARPCCHACHRQPSPAPHESTPQPMAPCHNDCQCICSGAVIEQGSHDLIGRSTTELALRVIPAERSDATDFSVEDPTVPGYHGSITPGRMICCLFMRFLC